MPEVQRQSDGTAARRPPSGRPRPGARSQDASAPHKYRWVDPITSSRAANARIADILISLPPDLVDLARAIAREVRRCDETLHVATRLNGSVETETPWRVAEGESAYLLFDDEHEHATSPSVVFPERNQRHKLPLVAVSTRGVIVYVITSASLRDEEFLCSVRTAVFKAHAGGAPAVLAVPWGVSLPDVAAVIPDLDHDEDVASDAATSTSMDALTEESLSAGVGRSRVLTDQALAPPGSEGVDLGNTPLTRHPLTIHFGAHNITEAALECVLPRPRVLTMPTVDASFKALIEACKRRRLSSHDRKAIRRAFHPSARREVKSSRSKGLTFGALFDALVRAGRLSSFNIRELFRISAALRDNPFDVLATAYRERVLHAACLSDRQSSMLASQRLAECVHEATTSLRDIQIAPAESRGDERPRSAPTVGDDSASSSPVPRDFALSIPDVRRPTATRASGPDNERKHDGTPPRPVALPSPDASPEDGAQSARPRFPRSAHTTDDLKVKHDTPAARRASEGDHGTLSSSLAQQQSKLRRALRESLSSESERGDSEGSSASAPRTAQIREARDVSCAALDGLLALWAPAFRHVRVCDNIFNQIEYARELVAFHLDDLALVEHAEAIASLIRLASRAAGAARRVLRMSDIQFALESVRSKRGLTTFVEQLRQKTGELARAGGLTSHQAESLRRHYNMLTSSVHASAVVLEDTCDGFVNGVRALPPSAFEAQVVAILSKPSTGASTLAARIALSRRRSAYYAHVDTGRSAERARTAAQRRSSSGSLLSASDPRRGETAGKFVTSDISNHVARVLGIQLVHCLPGFRRHWLPASSSLSLVRSLALPLREYGAARPKAPPLWIIIDALKGDDAADVVREVTECCRVLPPFVHIAITLPHSASSYPDLRAAARSVCEVLLPSRSVALDMALCTMARILASSSAASHALAAAEAIGSGKVHARGPERGVPGVSSRWWESVVVPTMELAGNTARVPLIEYVRAALANVPLRVVKASQEARSAQQARLHVEADAEVDDYDDDDDEPSSAGVPYSGAPASAVPRSLRPTAMALPRVGSVPSQSTSSDMDPRRAHSVADMRTDAVTWSAAKDVAGTPDPGRSPRSSAPVIDDDIEDTDSNTGDASAFTGIGIDVGTTGSGGRRGSLPRTSSLDTQSWKFDAEVESAFSDGDDTDGDESLVSLTGGAGPAGMSYGSGGRGGGGRDDIGAPARYALAAKADALLAAVGHYVNGSRVIWLSVDVPLRLLDAGLGPSVDTPVLLHPVRLVRSMYNAAIRRLEPIATGGEQIDATTEQLLPVLHTASLTLRLVCAAESPLTAAELRSAVSLARSLGLVRAADAALLRDDGWSGASLPGSSSPSDMSTVSAAPSASSVSKGKSPEASSRHGGRRSPLSEHGGNAVDDADSTDGSTISVSHTTPMSLCAPLLSRNGEMLMATHDSLRSWLVSQERNVVADAGTPACATRAVCLRLLVVGAALSLRSCAFGGISDGGAEGSDAGMPSLSLSAAQLLDCEPATVRAVLEAGAFHPVSVRSAEHASFLFVRMCEAAVPILERDAVALRGVFASCVAPAHADMLVALIHGRHIGLLGPLVSAGVLGTRPSAAPLLLHEAVLRGSAGVELDWAVEVATASERARRGTRRDAYGLPAVHYAAMCGNRAALRRFAKLEIPQEVAETVNQITGSSSIGASVLDGERRGSVIGTAPSGRRGSADRTRSTIDSEATDLGTLDSAMTSRNSYESSEPPSAIVVTSPTMLSHGIRTRGFSRRDSTDDDGGGMPSRRSSSEDDGSRAATAAAVLAARRGSASSTGSGGAPAPTIQRSGASSGSLWSLRSAASGSSRSITLAENHASALLDAAGRSALHHAAAHNQAVAVRDLVDNAGASVEARDEMGATPLHAAAESGNDETAEALMALGADPAARETTFSRTPLHLAAMHGRVACVRALLHSQEFTADGIHVDDMVGVESDRDGEGKSAQDSGGDDDDDSGSDEGTASAKVRLIDLVDVEGRTALHLAAAHGHARVVALLIESGANAMARDQWYGEMALHLAAQAPTGAASVKVLCSAGPRAASVRERWLGRTPLHYACVLGNVDMIRSLVRAISSVQQSQERSASVREDGEDSGGVVFSSDSDDPDDGSASGSDDDADDNISASSTEEARQVERLRRELSGQSTDDIPLGRSPSRGGVDLHDDDGATPLHIAAMHGHAAAAAVLLGSGASPLARDARARTPLHYASECGAAALARLLLRSAAADCDGDDSEKARQVLDGYHDLHSALRARDARGCSAAHLAARGGHLRVLNALADAGAISVHRDERGRTVAHVAAAHGRADALSVLLVASPSLVDVCDRGGATPLHAAAAHGQDGALAILLHAGGNMHARDCIGRVALHLAADEGHTVCAAMLVARDDSLLGARDCFGLTPVHLAARAGRLCALRVFAEVLLQRAKAGSQGGASGGGASGGGASGASGERASGDGAGVKRSAAGANGHGGDDGATSEAPAAPPEKRSRPVVRVVVQAPDDESSDDGSEDGSGLRSRPFTVDATDDDGASALLYAAAGGHTACMRLLGDVLRASWCVRDSRGRSVAHLAAAGGHTAALRLAFEKVGIARSTTPVHDGDGGSRRPRSGECMSIGAVEALDVLLAPDTEGWTPLHYAAWNNSAEAVQELIEVGGAELVRTSDSSASPHVLARRSVLSRGLSTDQLSAVDSVDVLSAVSSVVLSPVASPTGSDADSASAASDSSDDDDEADDEGKRVRRGSSASDERAGDADGSGHAAALALIAGNTPLHYAANFGNDHAVEVLLAHGADGTLPNVNGMTPLHCAAFHGHARATDLIAQECPAAVDTLDSSGRGALHYAAEHGHADAVAALLRARANATMSDGGGNAPLHYASRNGHVRAARMLLDAGANAKAHNEFDQEPLHLAALWGHAEIARVLVRECGADPAAADGDGQLPLHAAAQRGHVDVVVFLVEDCGVDPNAMDGEGQTALHYAAEGGHDTMDVVEYLVNGAGADVSLTNGMYLTAQDIAEFRGNLEVAEFLATVSGGAEGSDGERDEFYQD